MPYIPPVSAQAPSAVILVRATSFVPNPATAADNAFQADAPAGQTRGVDGGQGDGRDGLAGRGAARGRRTGPRLRRRRPHPPGQRVPQQLGLHPRRRHRGDLPDVRLQPPPRATCRRAGDAQVGVPRPGDHRLLRPRARRHLPRGHRCDGARPRLARGLHRAQLSGRRHGARALLHRLQLRADGLRRRRLRRRAGLPHQRHRLHRHRRRDDRPGHDPRPAAPRAGARAARGDRPHDRRADRGSRSASSPATRSSCAVVRRRAGAAT